MHEERERPAVQPHLAAAALYVLPEGGLGRGPYTLVACASTAMAAPPRRGPKLFVEGVALAKPSGPVRI